MAHLAQGPPQQLCGMRLGWYLSWPILSRPFLQAAELHAAHHLSKRSSVGSHATSAGASAATGCVAALRCMNFILEIRELSRGFLTMPSTSRLAILCPSRLP